jgi:regulator of replication initiation timing
LQPDRLKNQIESRIDELSREIRAYPTPIARCDEQLPALLEERSALLLELKALQEKESCSPQALWINDGGFHAA